MPRVAVRCASLHFGVCQTSPLHSLSPPADSAPTSHLTSLTPAPDALKDPRNPYAEKIIASQQKH